MQKMFSKALPVLLCTVLILTGCGTLKPSYSSASTEIEILKFRIPSDSAFAYSDTVSIAGFMPWQDFYRDEHLRRLIDEGLNNNLTLHTAILQIGKSESYYTKSKSEFWPEVSVSLSQDQIKRAIRDEAYDEHGVGLRLTQWELDIWGRLRSSKKAALADLLAKQYAAQAVKVKLIADIAKHYYKLIGLDTKLATVNDIIAKGHTYLNQQVHLKQKHQKKQLADSGIYLTPDEVTQYTVAVEQAKVELYKAESIKPDIETEIFITENALNLLLSRSSGTIPRAKFEDLMAGRFLMDTLQIGVPSDLLHFRPDVMAAEQTVQQAFHLQDAATRSLLPTLTLSGSLATMESYNADWSHFKGSVIYNLYAGITQPLFARGRLKHNRRLRKADAEISLDNYRQTVLKACVEVSNTLVFYQRNKTKLQKLMLQNAALNSALGYSQLLYEKEKASYLDVLAAQRPMLQTRLDLADAFVKYYDYHIELYKALGGGGL